jgi:hypothetical protein
MLYQEISGNPDRNCNSLFIYRKHLTHTVPKSITISHNFGFCPESKVLYRISASF